MLILSIMAHHMPFEVAGLRKSFSTNVTRERLFTCVFDHVSFLQGLAFENFKTYWASQVVVVLQYLLLRLKNIL